MNLFFDSFDKSNQSSFFKCPLNPQFPIPGLYVIMWVGDNMKKELSCLLSSFLVY